MLLTPFTAHTHPFSNVLHLEAASATDEVVICRLCDCSNRIVRMFSWKLVKGKNRALISGLECVAAGTCTLTIMDRQGNCLQAICCIKQVAVGISSLPLAVRIRAGSFSTVTHAREPRGSFDRQ